MNNATLETSSNNTQSKKDKNHSRLIGNNIQEKLFLAKLHDYKDKQKELLEKSKDLIKTHEQCIKLAKQTGTPNHEHIEEVDHVVTRIMDDALSARQSAAVTHRRDGPETTGRGVSLVAADLRVWGRGSLHVDALEAIAAKLLDVYTRHRAEADGLAAENERLRGLKAPGSQPSAAAAAAAAAVGRRDAVAAAVFVDLMSRVRDVAQSARYRDLRKRLALVTDRLKAVDKDKHDLLDVMHRNRVSRTATTETADTLRAMLDKERRKNEHLQAVVDEMFVAMAAHNERDRDQP